MPQPGYDLYVASRSHSHTSVNDALVRGDFRLAHHHLEDAFMAGAMWAREHDGRVVNDDARAPLWWRFKRWFVNVMAPDAPPGVD